ncbi:hypothetical protein Q9R32_09885 [Actinotalea sp. AC32]|nr:hypothetical protein [Actinotalea sp. AC32]
MTDRYALEHRLAPHVDERWTEALLLELRLRGVPGDTIGAVLAEVDSHVVESGEPAHDAFGDPVAYARSLDLPVDDEPGPRALLASTGPTAVQVLGLLVLGWAVPPLVRGEGLDLTWGHAALVVLLGAEVLLLVRHADAVLAAVVRRPVVSWLALTASTAVPVALLLLLRGVVVGVPAAAGVTVGTALLLAGTAWGLVRLRAHVDDADPVRSPLDGDEPSSRGAEVLAASGVWLVPAAAVVITALALVVG